MSQWLWLVCTFLFIFVTCFFLFFWMMMREKKKSTVSTTTQKEGFNTLASSSPTTGEQTHVPDILWVKNEYQTQPWGQEYPFYQCRLEKEPDDSEMPGHHLLTNMEMPFEGFHLDFEDYLNGHPLETEQKNILHFYRGTVVAVSIPAV